MKSDKDTCWRSVYFGFSMVNESCAALIMTIAYEKFFLEPCFISRDGEGSMRYTLSTHDECDAEGARKLYKKIHDFMGELVEGMYNGGYRDIEEAYLAGELDELV